MGQVTPNISIYIPAAGETNYDASFAAGMINIDQHDHSGPPTKGVPISGSGIAAGSITYDKLNPNVVTPGGGLAVSGITPNSLQVAGILTSLFNIPAGGILVATSTTTAINRTITGTTGQINVANGDGIAGNPTISIDPAFIPVAGKIVKQVFTTGGTYTPTSGMSYCSVDMVGGGGAGGGTNASGGQVGTGGGAGFWNTQVFSAATIGASQSVTIGAGGTGVSAGTGNTGGTTSFGAGPLLSATGGLGGIPTVSNFTPGGNGGSSGTGGLYGSIGGQGGANLGVSAGSLSGQGGTSQFGEGGYPVFVQSDGNAGVNFGSGGSGGNSAGVALATIGGAGAPGIVIITEYII